jgi:hypothetical protein
MIDDTVSATSYEKVGRPTCVQSLLLCESYLRPPENFRTRLATLMKLPSETALRILVPQYNSIVP